MPRIVRLFSARGSDDEKLESPPTCSNPDQIRKIALEELQRIQPIITIPPAFGAFYFLLRIQTDIPPLTVVERLIKEFKVAVIPGTAFGIEDACCLRVAYGALEESTARTGIRRLVEGLTQIV